MKKVIRAALVIYLCYSSIPMLFALPTWLEAPSLSTYALCILCAILLSGAALLVLVPPIGRWVTVLSQVPQVLCLAAPGYYFWIFSGFIATTGFSVLPADHHWTWRPEFEVRSGTFAALTFGNHPSPEAGYALIVNWVSLLVALAAFYGLREMKANQPSQPTPPKRRRELNTTGVGDNIT